MPPAKGGYAASVRGAVASIQAPPGARLRGIDVLSCVGERTVLPLRPPCPLLKHGNETLQQRCRGRAAADVQVDRHHIRDAPDTGIPTPTAVALKRCPGCPAPSPDPPPRISTMCRSMVAADGSSLLSNSSPARFRSFLRRQHPLLPIGMRIAKHLQSANSYHAAVVAEFADVAH